MNIMSASIAEPTSEPWCVSKFDAAPKHASAYGIQSFMRPFSFWRSPSSTSTVSSSEEEPSLPASTSHCRGASADASLGTVPILNAPNEQSASEPLPAPFSVYVWNGTSVGLDFVLCEYTGLPRVEDTSKSNESLPGMHYVNEGDLLVRVNGQATADMESLEQVLDVVENGCRPAKLEFRWPISTEMPHYPPSSTRRRSIVLRMRRKKQRKNVEKYLSYVFLTEEDGDVGLKFERVIAPVIRESDSDTSDVDTDLDRPTMKRSSSFPVVKSIKEDAEDGDGLQLEGKVTPGDWLLCINNWDVAEVGFEKAMQALEVAPRPLVLTFRRMSINLQQPRTTSL